MRYSITEGRAKVFLYGDIGESWWDEGLTAIDLATVLEQAGGIPVDIHINSGGGDVFEAHAMHTAISSYDGEVVVHIDGIAASAASYLGLNASRVVMAPHALMMIHKASMYTYGNADELRESAETLEAIDATLIGIYQRKTGISAEELSEMLRAETWLTAEEAQEKGFVDEIAEDAQPVSAKVGRRIAAAWKRKPEGFAVEEMADSEPAVPAEPIEDNPEPDPVPGVEITDSANDEGDAPAAQERKVVRYASGVYTVSQ